MTGKRLFNLVLAGMLAALLSSTTALAASGFHDPLDTPARLVAQGERRPFMAVTQAGDRLVAVGMRGLVVGSDDGGNAWTQAKVPVQSDLLAVHFPTASEGWSVGHDGVILHSGDGGKTWKKQLDGRLAAVRFKAFYTAMGEAGAKCLALLEQNYKAGAALPFLDVWFENAQHGYAVGSFGMLAATTDGGRTWEPWLHRIDNPEALNLNAIRGIGGEIHIAGERGQVYRLDRASRSFVRSDTGYIGSFFGIVGDDATLIAYGLRGTVYRGAAAGSKFAWHPVPMPNEHTLSAGIARNGEFVLANAAGELVLLDKSAQRPRLIKPDGQAMRMTGIVVKGAQAIVTGLDGIRRVALPNR